VKKSLEILSKIKELDIYLKTKVINQLFLKNCNDLIIEIHEQFDFSDNILDLNINNELIKNIIFIKFTKCLKDTEIESDRQKKNSIVNKDYDDAVCFCKKVLSIGRDNNISNSSSSNLNKDKKRTERNVNNFFEITTTKKGFEEIYVEILKIIKKDFKDTSLDGNRVKKLRGEKTNLTIKDLKVDEKNFQDAIKNVKEFLINYKNVLFAELTAELQYEYCIFQAENTKWISYQDNLYPISLTKRIFTEEKIQHHFFKVEDLVDNIANLNDAELNDSIDSKEYLINKEVFLI